VKIEIESEADDERSMFRLTLNGKLISDRLTAVQTHLLVGEIFEMAVFPNKRTLPQDRLAQIARPVAPRAA
jgi:hypothetical protein